MKTEPTPPNQEGERVTQKSANEADEGFEWVEDLLDQFQLSGKPIRELHVAWGEVVAALAAK